MILAAAQTKPKRGDIDANLLDHYHLVALAAVNKANLIVFPELSITGYEREDAKQLAFSPNDSRLNPLKKLAVENQITIIAGAPVLIQSELFLGEFIIAPDNSVSIYTKQFLHPGEEVYYQSSFNYNPILQIENERISCAICADIDYPQHPENAKKNNASIYIASIFFSPNGIPVAYQSLQSYATKHNMNVLMANFGGESYGSPSGGQSAFWNNKGELIAQMGDSDSGLLLVEQHDTGWISKILND
ncbi:carbon-nitrogen hydrolase family protein [Flavobacterium gawalongense]|uniref:Carbon-nitrogen hydrolase family protein n=1 Tax=Flavobacterium gawalongense TaxID=2594432 RepID=A0ABY3CFE0_9FLAO|nr:carbon-nitrogen hydrolase family protein [Flavobacterium gawalongense]TRW97964.1 carbon-nitrogen hydrolase family protein [Flavobacterium gawalongense]TRX02342.1 carbon-nitrogen hydrolase family protein [Flavobacterium gawalongense]